MVVKHAGLPVRVDEALKEGVFEIIQRVKETTTCTPIHTPILPL